MGIEADFSRLLRRFTPNTVFMHVGAADCAFAILAASYVERVCVVDPASIPDRETRLPLNLRVCASSEEGLPIPEGTVDVALTETRPSCASSAGASFPAASCSRPTARSQCAARCRLLAHQRALVRAPDGGRG
jgi:hypothetical protein